MIGCKKNYGDDQKVRLAYFGYNNELPLIAAFEEGYFEEEGLDVELVKINYEEFTKDINNKNIDGGTCDYRIFKSIEEGINIKIGAGLHSSSVEILTQNGSDIKTISDLKNKKIGIQKKGEGTMIAAKALFDKYDIDVLRDIEWIYFEGEQLKNSLRKGEVDGVILWQNNEKNNEFKTIYRKNELDSASAALGHSHHGNEYYYISFAGISKEIADNYPEKAAGILRAWIQGANKVAENKEECLQKAIDNGYIKGNYVENYDGIETYMWMPSVKYAKDNVKAYIEMQKSIGLLSDSLDVDEFYKNSFADVLPYWD